MANAAGKSPPYRKHPNKRKIGACRGPREKRAIRTGHPKIYGKVGSPRGWRSAYTNGMRKLIFVAAFMVLLTAGALAQLRLDTSIYPANADAKQEVADALQRAKAEHKRVLLVFGADWCYDCHVLDARFHEPEIQPFLEKHFVVVHIDIGRGEKNQDLTQKYKIPLNKGVPSVAVVTADDKLLESTQNGEIEGARRMPAGEILAFLEKWAAKG